MNITEIKKAGSLIQQLDTVRSKIAQLNEFGVDLLCFYGLEDRKGSRPKFTVRDPDDLVAMKSAYGKLLEERRHQLEQGLKKLGVEVEYGP